MSRLACTRCRVLITRPIKQAHVLASQLEEIGIEPWCHPVLQIVPMLTDPKTTLIETVKHADWLIFTSCNAVEYALPYLKPLWQTGAMPALIAIGQRTADALTQANLAIACLPDRDFSSEGLLDMPFMQACEGKHITILAGMGGRTHLQTVLTQRGAVVNKCALYQRVPAHKPSPAQLMAWHQARFDAIIITSGQSLTQLVEWMNGAPANARWLKDQQLLLISQRLLPLAQTYGFVRAPWVASHASDAGLVAALQHKRSLRR